jgi:glycosyltransferase involved in cell wall biosynthesis
MGEAARTRVRERFSWDAVTDATVAAYEEVRGVGSPE